jgi:acyl carrier protein
MSSGVENAGGDNMRNMQDRIRALVAEQLGVDVADVAPTATILDDLGADSLDVVELVMSLEDLFDIEVPDEEVDGMRTVADIHQYVIAHIA